MATTNYSINDIESLSFKDGVRSRIAMYLGSADMTGVYNAIQEIISNSIDEFYMGFGKEITITINGNRVCVTDNGRGVPFGKKEDGSNVLVDIFSRAHTGGKFNDKVYNSVAGLNGIGAKATCLSSTWFQVISMRDGKLATAVFEKGELTTYREEVTKNKITGTVVEFEPDPEVYNLEPIKIEFDHVCDTCRNLSYLTKGLRFVLTDGTTNKTTTYCAQNGLLDLIKDNAIKPLHSTPVYAEIKEGNISAEVAMMWTAGKEKSFTFTNGLQQIEGGTSLTGVKTAITNFIKKSFSGDFDGDIARSGLVYAVSCKVPNPSYANQTKTKINNPELRGLSQRTATQALTTFSTKYATEFQNIINLIAKERKATVAAENARKKVLEATQDIERNTRKKVFASDKLKDAEFLGENSILLCVEGNSAASSMAMARDVKKYGILALRGKMINCLANDEEDIFENEEIKLLLSALNITPGTYNSRKLRYGKVAITTDGDADGHHIGLLIMAALRKLAPQFLAEGRLCWLRSPLYIVKNGKTESYYYTDEEMDAARGKVRGEIQRNKGLGSMSPEQARNSMFTPANQRLDILQPDAASIALLEDLMGEDVSKRREYIFNHVDFSTIHE